MIGSKPLTNTEVNLLMKNLSSQRDRLLVILGTRTGFRISELLSLTVGDCIQYGKVKESITVSRSNMKGKFSSRTVVLHDEAKKYLKSYINNHMNKCNPKDKLFPICRQHIDRILKKAIKKAKLEGKVSSHSFRKTFCKRIHEALDKNLINTQRAMGHKSLSSTVNYLSFDQDVIDNAIKGV
jgi:integrase